MKFNDFSTQKVKNREKNEHFFLVRQTHFNWTVNKTFYFSVSPTSRQTTIDAHFHNLHNHNLQSRVKLNVKRRHTGWPLWRASSLLYIFSKVRPSSHPQMTPNKILNNFTIENIPIFSFLILCFRGKAKNWYVLTSSKVLNIITYKELIKPHYNHPWGTPEIYFWGSKHIPYIFFTHF